MGQVFKSPAYFVLLALGLANAMGSLWFATDAGRYGGVIYPVTRVLLTPLMGSFGLIPMIIAIYYSGELVWRERERKTHEIIDATPVPDWAFVGPKTLAISLVLISTLLVSVLAAIISQLAHGYTNLELSKYLLWYVLPQSVSWILLAVLAVFLQAISPHKFIGWGLMVLYLIARITFNNLGFEHRLYNYASVTEVPLSDMNGQGKFWIGAWWLRAYWTAFAVILLVLAYGLWRRGTESRLWPRLRRLPRRMTGKAGATLAVSLAAFAATGIFIYVNTNIWNDYRTNIDDEKWRADYEKTLLGFETVPQPKIVSMTLDVDLYPGEPRVDTKGAYRAGEPHRRAAEGNSRSLRPRSGGQGPVDRGHPVQEDLRQVQLSYLRLRHADGAGRATQDELHHPARPEGLSQQRRGIARWWVTARS